jgi:hypothetical protein
VPRMIFLIGGIVSSWFVIIVFNDYRSIEKEYTGYRMLAARISGAEVPIESNVIILRSLHSALKNLRVEPRRNMLPADLDNLQSSVIRYPVTSGLVKYARATALNNRPEDAMWALNLICNLRSYVVCGQILSEWESALVEGDLELGRVRLPAVPDRLGASDLSRSSE